MFGHKVTGSCLENIQKITVSDEFQPFKNHMEFYLQLKMLNCKTKTLDKQLLLIKTGSDSFNAN